MRLAGFGVHQRQTRPKTCSDAGKGETTRRRGGAAASRSSRSFRDASSDQERKEAVELISFGLEVDHQQDSVTEVVAENRKRTKEGPEPDGT